MSTYLFKMRKLALLSFVFAFLSTTGMSYAAASEEGEELVTEQIEVVIAPEKKAKKEPFKWVFGDSSLELSARLRAEMFYGAQLTLLNNHNCNLDKILVPVKHTFDLGTIYGFGCKTHGHDIVKMKMTLRTKGTWGAPETVATTEDSPVKIGEVVTGNHSHVISRNIFWLREIWLEATMNEMFGFEEGRWRHSLTLGYFPFLLGRGIALGDAYATDPDALGYYSPSAIDQYAPGIRFTGQDVCSEKLSYDVYLAILNNKSNTFSNVNLNIRGQQYGHEFFQQRGFGVINWLIAGRLKWWILKGEDGELLFEPYGLYDSEKEQKVVFLGDANSKLGTVGFALEGSLGNVEFGFDFAQNLGRQKVKGWDRNIIETKIRSGTFVAVNSAVKAIDSINGEIGGEDALYTPANQAIIDTSVRAESQNGQVIGANLQNKNDRFNDCYTNHYRGFMAVGDFGYNFTKSFKMCLTGGIASGDENPNKNLELVDGVLKDVNYNGFISLQELYSGVRVRSVFLLSGAGRVPRLLSFPSPQLGSEFPQTVNRFTNIQLVGWSAWYEGKRGNINTNILCYWQQHATRIPNRMPSSSMDIGQVHANSRHASLWLGTEINLFTDYKLYDDVKCYFIGSTFIPGSHFKDITGLPLSKAQQKFLDRKDKTGNNVNFVPTVGHDVAYTINMGVEYKF